MLNEELCIICKHLKIKLFWNLLIYGLFIYKILHLLLFISISKCGIYITSGKWIFRYYSSFASSLTLATDQTKFNSINSILTHKHFYHSTIFQYFGIIFTCNISYHTTSTICQYMYIILNFFFTGLVFFLSAYIPENCNFLL